VTGSVVLGLHVSKVRRASPAWWLMAPAVIGFALVICDFGNEGIVILGALEGVALSAWLGLVAVSTPGKRVLTLGRGFLLTAIVTTAFVAVLEDINLRDAMGWVQITTIGGLLSAIWFVPAAVAVLLLRGRFSMRRFVRMTVIVWLATGILLTALFLCLAGFREGVGIALASFTIPLPCLVGLVLFVGLSRWHRNRFMRALRLVEVSGGSLGGEVIPSGSSQTPGAEIIEPCGWPRL